MLGVKENLLGRGLLHCPDADPRQIFVCLQQIGARALDDFEQIIHGRNFRQLLAGT